MLSNEVEYSEAEWKLIDEFGLKDFAINSRVMPPVMYREMAVLAVKQGLSGPAVKALGRGLNAIDDCNPYRMTPEFDALIRF